MIESPRTLSTAREIDAELTAKRRLIQSLLAERNLDAIQISRHENIAWFTAGLAEIRIGLLRETGAASLLITKDNRVFYITTNNEAPRLAEEEFETLDYTPIVQPWFAADQAAAIRSVVGEGLVATDMPNGAMPLVSLYPTRAELMESEVARYRWLGHRVGEVASELLLALEPGMTERGIQARLVERLTEQCILPSVLLDAVDERVRKFRHAVPRNGTLTNFGMLNFCARRWGLSVSITRLVHFGTMPQELAEKFEAVAEVSARLLAATRTGAMGSELFDTAREAYAAAGYAGEEAMHHQGGATGYLEREWVARPNGTERVGKTQAFAWNPSVQGAKVEDTVLLRDGSLELLTPTPALPVLSRQVNGVGFGSAGVLLR